MKRSDFFQSLTATQSVVLHKPQLFYFLARKNHLLMDIDEDWNGVIEDEDDQPEKELPVIKEKSEDPITPADMEQLNATIGELEPIRSDDLMRLVTSQGSKLKILFETLSNVLVDGLITFTPQGMMIEQISTNQCMVQVKLDAVKIESYYCKDTYKLGMNFSRLFVVMKNITKDDVVLLRLTKKSFEQSTPMMVVELISVDGTRYGFSINLMDIDDERYNMPEKVMDICITLPSLRFCRIMKCCEKQGSMLQFMTGDNVVKFGTHGDHFSSCCVTIPVNGVGESPDQLVYCTALLMHVAKASAMCNCVKILIAKDYPLMLVCEVGTLGVLRFFIPPRALEEDDLASFPANIQNLGY